MVRAFATAALLSAQILSVSPRAAPGPEDPTGSATPAAQSPTGTATEAEARIACSTCHLFPPADILPRRAWRDEISRMSLLRDNQPAPAGPPGMVSRMVQLPPDFARVLRYYEQQAPQHLPSPDAWPEANRQFFAVRAMNAPADTSSPAVSNVRLLDVDGNRRLEVVATDMRSGQVFIGKPYGTDSSLRQIALLNNPCHVSMLDFDGDGIQDFLVADLGEFLPGDHTQGAVVLLRGTRDGTYRAMALDGWPRVADVEGADFNGDGKVDLAVAAFGWRQVGNLTLLENHTEDYSEPSFTPRLLDPRPGAIHAIPVDLNKDGRLDLVVLFAQQFETVMAFINNGTPEISFTPQVIYTGPHPNWGSSGIQVVDLDGDGDPDVLLTHGDTFDDRIIKPYHGIQWLENRGTFPFTEHTLASMPGVSRAEAADLDGDGDLDIVASAFIAAGSEEDVATLPSLVWLEQTKPGVFVRHTLESGNPYHATLDVGDFDADGDVDIVVGNFFFTPDDRTADWIQVWENTRAPVPTQ